MIKVSGIESIDIVVSEFNLSNGKNLLGNLDTERPIEVTTFVTLTSVELTVALLTFQQFRLVKDMSHRLGIP